LQVELRKDLFPGGKQAAYDWSSAYWEMDMDRFKVPEEKRHSASVESANGSASQVEQIPQIHRFPQPGESRSVDPELDVIMMGIPTAFNPKAAGDLDATIQYALTGEGSKPNQRCQGSAHLAPL
jgi:hypothetical protein